MPSLRRYRPLILLAAIWLAIMYYLFNDDAASEYAYPPSVPAARPGSGHHETSGTYDLYKEGAAENGGQLDAARWRKLPERFPVAKPRSLPSSVSAAGGTSRIPKIQAEERPTESEEARATRLQRLAAVKESFVHSWQGYKTYGWMHDEVTPLTMRGKDPFGGWAATLVDALDTLWIMGLTDEFEAAVQAADTVDFGTNPQEKVNIFETTIRYLGGFLAAYELSGKQYDVLLKKAVEVADLVMCAFDTESRMPIARWDWK